MGDIIAIDRNELGLPNELLEMFDAEDKSLTAGIEESYSIVSYRGKVWRVKRNGEEKPLLNADGDAIPTIRVILLAASEHVNRTYYDKAFAEGDDNPPVCSSSDGVVPVPGPRAQSKKCDVCPQNQFGSRISDNGTEAKACQESRRVAIAPAEDITNERFGGAMLLRVVGQSLRKELAEYGRLLQSIKVPTFAVVTKIGFDSDAAYPKLVFSIDVPATKALTAKDRNAIIAMKDSDQVKQILTPRTVADVPKEEPQKTVETKPSTPPAAQSAEADPDSIKISEVDAGDLGDIIDDII